LIDSSAVDIEVKRGTQAILEKEEAEKKEKEEARKRARYAIKFKRVNEASKVKGDEEEKSDEGEAVSDEDLSQFGDFVYQACEDEDEDIGLLFYISFDLDIGVNILYI
jgi:lysyl-tRNA synthetase class I